MSTLQCVIILVSQWISAELRPELCRYLRYSSYVFSCILYRYIVCCLCMQIVYLSSWICLATQSCRRKLRLWSSNSMASRIPFGEMLELKEEVEEEPLASQGAFHTVTAVTVTPVLPQVRGLLHLYQYKLLWVDKCHLHALSSCTARYAILDR